MRTPGAEAGRAEFDARHADPENAAAYADAKEDWLITGGVAEEHLTAHRQVPSKATPPSRAHWALAAALILALSLAFRSEERRVGQECVIPCRSRRSPKHNKHK